MTSVVISQPMLFPWPGFFEQLMLADAYLFLDDTQFSKGSFTNRVQLRMGGESVWMTIPLARGGAFQRIDELQEACTDWRQRHLDQLRESLRGAPYLDEVLSLVDRCYSHTNLCDLLIASIELSAAYVGVGTRQKRVRTSAMGVEGRSWQRVLDLARTVQGTRYLTGHGAAAYLNHESFERAGISVEYMAYSQTPWPSPAKVFSPYVSILDLMAHMGPAAIRYLVPATTGWREFLASRNNGDTS